MKDGIKRTVTITISTQLFEKLEKIRTERLWNKKTLIEYYLEKGLATEDKEGDNKFWKKL